MNIQQALDVHARSISYRDAEVLLSHVLQVDRSWLYSHSDTKLTNEQEIAHQALLARREHSEPVAYILGYKEFYGRPFSVNKHVLIPRPETEAVIDHVVEAALLAFKKNLKATNKPCPTHILELGTGSGNISITLALELAKHPTVASLIATELSPEALQVAEQNWKKLSGESNQHVTLDFIEASLFDHPTIRKQAPYDIIVANLPYVADDWKMNPAAQPDVVFHEPDLALFGGADGLNIYRDFFAQAPQFLTEDGVIIIEYGEDQTPALLPIAQAAFPTKKASVFQDYAGLDRVIVLR